MNSTWLMNVDVIAQPDYTTAILVVALIVCAILIGSALFDWI